MTGLYFAVVGLDIMNSLHLVEKNKIVEFVYLMQLFEPRVVSSSDEVYPLSQRAGFIGSNYLSHNATLKSTTELESCSACGFLANISTCFECPIPQQRNIKYIQGHLAMTYTALSILTTLGDDLSRVKKSAITYGTF